MEPNHNMNSNATECNNDKNACLTSIQSYTIIEEIHNNHSAVQYLCRRESSFRKIHGKLDPYFILTKYPKATSLHRLVSNRIESLLFLQEKDLIHVHECFFSENDEFCVVEKLEPGLISLRQYLFEKKQTSQILSCFSEILQALRILHAIDQVYGTLNCSNILVDTRNAKPRLLLRPFLMDIPLLKLFPLQSSMHNLPTTSGDGIGSNLESQVHPSSMKQTQRQNIPEFLRKKRLLSYTTLEKIEDPYSFSLNDEGKLSIMQFQENWVWYEAPENVFLMTKHHISSGIDLWALGCIIMELYISHPIFSANSIEDQIVNTIHVLGYPNKNDIEGLNQLGFFDYVNNGENMEIKTPEQVKDTLLQVIQKSTNIKIEKNYNDVDLALDLVVNLLQFNPKNRVQISQAMEHPLFKINAQELFSIIHRSTKTPMARPRRHIKQTLSVNTQPEEKIPLLNNIQLNANVDTPQLTKIIDTPPEKVVQTIRKEKPTVKKIIIDRNEDERIEIPTFKKDNFTKKTPTAGKEIEEKEVPTVKKYYSVEPPKNVKSDTAKKQVIEFDHVTTESLHELYEKRRNIMKKQILNSTQKKKFKEQEKLKQITIEDVQEVNSISSTTPNDNVLSRKEVKDEVKRRLRQAAFMKKLNESAEMKATPTNGGTEVINNSKKSIKLKDITLQTTPLRKPQKRMQTAKARSEVGTKNRLDTSIPLPTTSDDKNMQKRKVEESILPSKKVSAQSSNDKESINSMNAKNQSKFNSIQNLQFQIRNILPSPTISTPGNVSRHLSHNVVNEIPSGQSSNSNPDSTEQMNWITDEEFIYPDSPTNIYQPEENVKKMSMEDARSILVSNEGPVSTLTQTSNSIEESLVLVSLLNECKFDLKELTKRLLHQSTHSNLMASPKKRHSKPSLKVVTKRKIHEISSYNENDSDIPDHLSTPFSSETLTVSNVESSSVTLSEDSLTDADVRASLRRVKQQLKHLKKSNYKHAKMLKKVSYVISPHVIDKKISYKDDKYAYTPKQELHERKVSKTSRRKRNRVERDTQHHNRSSELSISNLPHIMTYDQSDYPPSEISDLPPQKDSTTRKSKESKALEDSHVEGISSKDVNTSSTLTGIQKTIEKRHVEQQQIGAQGTDERFLSIIIDSMKSIPSKARFYLFSWSNDECRIEIPVQRRFKEREMEGKKKFVEEKFCVRVRDISRQPNSLWSHPLNIDLYQTADDLGSRKNCLATCTVDLYLLSLCMNQEFYEVNGWYHVLSSTEEGGKIFGQMQIRTWISNINHIQKRLPSKITVYEGSVSQTSTRNSFIETPVQNSIDMYQSRNGTYMLLTGNESKIPNELQSSFHDQSLKSSTIHPSTHSQILQETQHQEEIAAILSETEQLIPPKLDNRSANFEDIWKTLSGVEEFLLGKNLSKVREVNVGYESNGETKHLETTLAQLKKLNSSLGVASQS